LVMMMCATTPPPRSNWTRCDASCPCCNSQRRGTQHTTNTSTSAKEAIGGLLAVRLSKTEATHTRKSSGKPLHTTRPATSQTITAMPPPSPPPP
jgi:hypothetical protein